MQEGQRAPPFVPKVGPRWCRQVEKFLAGLADKYYRTRLKVAHEPFTYLELHIIELYHGRRDGILPAYASQGLAAQNPRLLEAFSKLAAADARYENKPEKD